MAQTTQHGVGSHGGSEVRGVKRSHRSRLLLVLAAGLIAVAVFERWKMGSPNGAPDVSPNGRYFVQKYANWTPRSLWPAGPGQGSDGAGGYVRGAVRAPHLPALEH